MVFVLVCKIQGATLSEPITEVEDRTAQVARDIYEKMYYLLLTIREV